jgi:hypothetical protein
MTAAGNATFTAAQYNANIRDNFPETETGKATFATGYFVATGSNAIVQRVMDSLSVFTSESTTSTSYTDLATPGPAKTVTTGTQALVWICGTLSTNTDDAIQKMSFAVSGASTIAAADSSAIIIDGQYNGSPVRRGICQMVTLTAGSNTFTAKYAQSGGTATFMNRSIIVLPL